MKNNFKKFLAFALATTMMLSSSIAILAAEEGDTSGSGELEGTVNTDVFTVVLPTIPADDKTFDFVLDPEGLIEATDGDRHGENTTFEPGATLYFASVSGNTVSANTYDYNKSSDSLTVTNKSTMDVDITLAAAISGLGGAKMTSDPTFANDTTASIYLALVDATNKKALDQTAGATMKEEIDSAEDGSYKIVWNSTDSKYEYQLTDEAQAANYDGFSTYSFYMEGACNSDGDWSELSAIAPTVEVTWSVDKRATNAAPSIATKTYTMTAGSPVVVNVNLGAGEKAATEITKITYNNSSGVATDLATTHYTYADGVLTIKSSYVDGLTADRDFKVIFNDTAATEVTITLKK